MRFPAQSMAISPVTASVPSPQWFNLKIPGGGYVTGMDIHPDGTLTARIDVFGGYAGSTTLGTQWRQLVTKASMPAAYTNNHPYAEGGLYEVRIAPSNSSILYMFYGISGRGLSTVLKSINKGVTWSSTNFPNGIFCDPNEQPYRELRGQNMAIDPNNSNVVYAGTTFNGLFVTLDGGANWSAVPAVPTPVSIGVCAIAFDPTSGTTGGKTNRIIVGSSGNGLYVSADAGSTWNKIIGSPTNPGHGKVGIDGTYYCNTIDQSQVWRLTTANVLTNITPAADSYATVICDPFNADHMAVMRIGGYFTVSLNCRAAVPVWTFVNFAHSVVAPDAPWIQNSQDIFLSDGEAWFDPAVANRVWFAMGTAVLYTDDVYAVTAAGTNQLWTSQTSGMESLVANQVIVPPGGVPILCNWDRPFWRITNPDAAQANYGPAYDTPIRQGRGIDYASSTPSFIAAVTSDSQNGNDNYGFSVNFGVGWSQWPTIPAGFGGAIAATDTNRIIIARSNNGQLFQTQNQGASWTAPPTLPNNSGWGGSVNNNAQPVCADRVNIGTFYAYNYNTPGVYRSTDGGITWALVFSGHISANDSFELQMLAVPGLAGHLCFTAGTGSDLGDYTTLATLAASFPTGIGFFRCTNAAAANPITWGAVPGITDVICFGFGAPKPGGGGHPAVYTVAWVGGVYGIWRSDNFELVTPTWTKLDTSWPRDWTDLPKCISGDPNVYGSCYVGFQGSSFAYEKLV